AEVFSLPRLTRWAQLACFAMLAISLGQFIDLHDSSPQRQVADYFLSHTAPYAKIYASPPHHPIFRRDRSYFSYTARLTGDAGAEFDRLHPHVIDRKILDDVAWPPELVFLDPDFRSYWPRTSLNAFDCDAISHLCKPK